MVIIDEDLTSLLPVAPPGQDLQSRVRQAVWKGRAVRASGWSAPVTMQLIALAVHTCAELNFRSHKAISLMLICLTGSPKMLCTSLAISPQEALSLA